MVFVYDNDYSFTYGGTGWLIANDVVVTAAHLVYDAKSTTPSTTFQKLSSVLVYIGYNGSHSMEGQDGVEMRYGRRVAAPTAWLQSVTGSHTGGPRDVAFVQLDTPFADGGIIEYSNITQHEDAILGIVGYPMDKEGGHYMYQHFDSVLYELWWSSDMLSYLLCTYAGKSNANAPEAPYSPC